MNTFGRIRSFSMSTLLLNQSMRDIENQFDVSLKYLPSLPTESITSYYPQFEQSVRAEAETMSERYQLFYCLETSIRRLITEALRDAEGVDWWAKTVPPVIQQEVSTRIQKEIDSGITRRSDYEIDFTTFGELSNIITSNWTLFSTIFKSRKAVERVMFSLNALRNPIAHCCPLSEDEGERLKLTVKDWFRIIG